MHRGDRGFTLDRRRRPAEGPLPRRHADCPVGNPQDSAAGSTGCLRHGGGPTDSRRGPRERPVASVEPGVPARPLESARGRRRDNARDGAGRSPSSHSKWRSGPESRRGGSNDSPRRLVRPHGCRPASAVRIEQLRVSLVREAAQRERVGDGDRARQVEWHRADRRQRCLRRSGWCWRRRADGVRARRHVVCDDRWWRRQQPSGSERSGRQSAAPQG